MQVAMDQIAQGAGTREGTRTPKTATRGSDRMRPVTSPGGGEGGGEGGGGGKKKALTVFLDAPPATCQARLAGSNANAAEVGGVGLEGGLLAQVDDAMFARVLSLLLVEGSGAEAARGDGGGDGVEKGVEEGAGGGGLVMDWREVGRAEDVWNMVRGATEASFRVPSVLRAPTGFQVRACEQRA